MVSFTKFGRGGQSGSHVGHDVAAVECRETDKRQRGGFDERLHRLCPCTGLAGDKADRDRRSIDDVAPAAIETVHAGIGLRDDAIAADDCAGDDEDAGDAVDTLDARNEQRVGRWVVRRAGDRRRRHTKFGRLSKSAAG